MAITSLNSRKPSSSVCELGPTLLALLDDGNLLSHRIKSGRRVVWFVEKQQCCSRKVSMRIPEICDSNRIARLRQARAAADYPLRGGANIQGGAGSYKKKTGHRDRVTVRPATAGDVHHIRSLSKKVFQQYGPYENMLGRWFESGITVTFLALMGKRPVGFAMLGRLERESYLPRVSELLAIAVEPIKWKLGIGDLLMRNVERKAKDLKVETLVLHTAVENLPGQKLFKKHGFTPSKIKKNFYPEG